MKKYNISLLAVVFAIVLCLATVFGLTSCLKSNPTSEPTQSSPQTPEHSDNTPESGSTTESDEAADADSLKHLVFELLEGNTYSVKADPSYIFSLPQSLKIPSHYNGKPVTYIKHNAFYGCRDLTNVIIPNSVVTIGYDAFAMCSGLTNITIPNSVATIEDYAFMLCSSLTSLTISDGVTSIGRGTFAGCNSLTNVTIPDSVISIGDMSFYNCGGLKSVTIGKGAESIGYGLFACINDSNLIEEFAYKNGSNLKKITVSAENKKYYSINNCLIDRETKTIVSGCNTSIIPMDESITSIGIGAFAGCKYLTNVAIPASVTEIGEDAFNGCSALEKIVVETENERYCSIGNCLIEKSTKTLIQGCKNSVIPNDGSVTNIGHNAFSNCTTLTSIAIPDCVTSIARSAFSECYGLTSIIIGSGVTDVKFSYCRGLEEIIVATGNEKYYSSGNCLIDKSTKTLVQGCNKSIIPSDGSVTSIGESAFSGSGLTSITIPNSITNIGKFAFYKCSNLISATIPASVTDIGYAAFADCYAMEELIIAEDNENYCNKGNCLIDKTTKTLIQGFNNSFIPNDGSVTRIAAEAFNSCDFTNMTIPNGVTRIEGGIAGAFIDCKNLISITIPNSITYIGCNGFGECNSLIKIDFSGTKAEWKAIEKENGWNNGTKDYTVYCTDGKLDKYDNEID